MSERSSRESSWQCICSVALCAAEKQVKGLMPLPLAPLCFSLRLTHGFLYRKVPFHPCVAILAPIPATLIYAFVPMTLPFLGHHINRPRQYVAMETGSCHCPEALRSTQGAVGSAVLLTSKTHSFRPSGLFGLFPGAGSSEWTYCKHSCLDFYRNIRSHVCKANTKRRIV